MSISVSQQSTANIFNRRVSDKTPARCIALAPDRLPDNDWALEQKRSLIPIHVTDVSHPG